MGAVVFLVHESANVRAGTRRLLADAGHLVRDHAALEAVLVDREARRADLLILGWTSEIGTRAAIGRIKASEDPVASRLLLLVPQDQVPIAIRALEYGADDCVALPLIEDEFLARCHACLRRAAHSPSADCISAGPLLLDKAAHRVLINDQPVELAPAEFRLLTYFLENQGRVHSRGELLRSAWERKIDAGPRTVDVHVRRLRKTLEPFDCQDMIQTVRGFGYRFSVPTAQTRTRTYSGIVRRMPV